jgi:thiol-disulfide isomerase/thioredoxin
MIAIAETSGQDHLPGETMRKWLVLTFVAAWLAMAYQKSAWAAEGEAGSTATLVGVEHTAKPLFALPSLDGPPRELAQSRGRILLVHFFATWCEPCRPEMARLQELRVGLEGQPFEILAISVAEADSAVRRFFFPAPPAFSILLDRDRAVSKAWNINRLPTTIVLDHRLQARLIAEGDVDWRRTDVRDALDVLLKEVTARSDARGR